MSRFNGWFVRLREAGPDGREDVMDYFAYSAEEAADIWRRWCDACRVPRGAVDWYDDTLCAVVEENGKTVSMVADRFGSRE